MVEVIGGVELNLLLYITLENVGDATEIILVSRAVVGISLTNVNDLLPTTALVNVIDDVEVCSLLDTLTDLTDRDASSLFDAALENITDAAEVTFCAKVTDFVKLSLLLTTVLVAVTDGTSLPISTLVNIIDGVETCSVAPNLTLDRVKVRLLADIAVIVVTDGTKFSSLLDDTTLSITEDVVVVSSPADTADVSLLLNCELVKSTDDMEIPSLLEIILTEIADDVPLETELVNINVTAEVCSLVIMAAIVEFSSLFVAVLVEVTDGAVVGLLDNGLVCSLLDITLVDVTDDADDNLLLETEVVNVSNEAEACSIAVLGIVEFSSLFVTVLFEVTVCTGVSSLFDAAVVEVADAVDAIDCVVEEFLLLDMILILLKYDADIKLSDTEISTVTVAMVGTTDVELTSLLATSTVEVTVCAEFSSLLDIALVDVLGMFDISLVIDDTDICPALIEAMNDVVADSLVDTSAVDVAVKALDCKEVCWLPGNILLDVTDSSPSLDNVLKKATVCAKSPDFVNDDVTDGIIVSLLFNSCVIEGAEVCSVALKVVMDSNSTMANVIGVGEAKELDITDGAEVEITYSGVCSLLNDALIDILDVGVMGEE